MTKNLRIRVTGKVQGVNFRDSTAEFATRQGIRGIVQNEPDGSVYLEAEADEAELEKLLQWLEHGPAAADIDAVHSDEGTPQHYQNFQVAG